MLTVFSVLILIASIVIIAAVMLQEPKQGGLGAIDGSSTNLFSKSSAGKDAVLSKITIIAFVVFLISAIGIAAIN